MEASDITIEILKGIRQDLRDLGGRVDGTNARIDEVSRRIVESEIRTSTAIADLAGTVREMTSMLRASNELRPRVERCENDIAEIKRRVG